jgi:hypothetical protein
MLVSCTGRVAELLRPLGSFAGFRVGEDRDAGDDAAGEQKEKRNIDGLPCQQPAFLLDRLLGPRAVSDDDLLAVLEFQVPELPRGLFVHPHRDLLLLGGAVRPEDS